MQILTSLLHFGQLDVAEAKKFDFAKQRIGEIPRATFRTHRKECSIRDVGGGGIVTQVLPDATDSWRWPVHSNRSVKILSGWVGLFTCFRPGRGLLQQASFLFAAADSAR